MRYLILTLLAFLVQNVLLAQVTFIAPTKTVVEGSATVSTDIRLHSTDTLTTAQFTLSWDTAVLSYFLVDSFGLPGMSADNFGTSNTATGKLTFVWIDNSSSGLGVRFRDSIRAFRLVFRIRGGANTFSNLAFTDAPTRTKATNSTFINLPINKQDGRISVTTRVATSDTEAAPLALTLAQNVPNPCIEETLIPFEVAAPTAVVCRFFDLNGLEIWTQTVAATPGQNVVKITTSHWPSGIYVYSLQANNTIQTRTLIKQ